MSSLLQRQSNKTPAVRVLVEDDSDARHDLVRVLKEEVLALRKRIQELEKQQTRAMPTSYDQSNVFEAWRRNQYNSAWSEVISDRSDGRSSSVTG